MLHQGSAGKAHKITGKHQPNTLSIPNSKEECPLTLNSIVSFTLPFLPDTIFMWHLMPACPLPSLQLVHKGHAVPKADHLRCNIASRIQSTMAQEEEEEHAFHIFSMT